MQKIIANIQNVKEKINQAAKRAGRTPDDITLVAVSKRKPLALIEEALEAGQVDFGESYIQEAVDKITTANNPAYKWHFIGHIQSNKAKMVAENFDIVESVDRIKIAKALDKHLDKLQKTMPVYLQVNISQEPQKSGVMPDKLQELACGVAECKWLKIVGIMGMPPFNPEPEHSRKYFREMRQLAAQLKQELGVSEELGLSMGMSGDYEIAIEEGSTLVRVGTALFGQRD